jgi:hypothetical protein
MANSDYSRVQRPNGSMPLNAWVLVALIVVGFGILHVIAGMALHNTASSRFVEPPSAAIHGD